jgi:hypothetical protein
MHVSGRSDAEITRLTGHKSVETTHTHYIKDMAAQGNVFSNPESSLLSVCNLKRSLPQKSLQIKPSPSDTLQHTKAFKLPVRQVILTSHTQGQAKRVGSVFP